MPTFGKTTIGATRDGRIANSLDACRYVCPENAVLTRISAYISLYNDGYYVKAAVYSDLNGSPNSLLAESLPVAVGTALNWYDFPMPPINIPANTPVWLCLLANTSMSIYWDAGEINQFQARQSIYPTFANPFVSPAETFAWAVSIYAEYTLLSVVYVNLTVAATIGGTTDTGYPPGGPYSITQGSQITVTAIPYSNYLFDHWEVDGVPIGVTNPYTIIMDTNHTLTAVFAQIPQFNLTVDSNPQGISFTLEKIE